MVAEADFKNTQVKIYIIIALLKKRYKAKVKEILRDVPR